MEFISRAGYRPGKDHHLADDMGVMTHERPAFRAALKELAAAGNVRKIKGNRWIAATPEPERTGSLHVSPQGHGMVRLDGLTGAEAEVFIPPGAIGSALHGDRVAVEIMPSRERGREHRDDARIRQVGRVTGVVERRKRVLVGLLMKSPAYWYVIPDQPRINQNIRVGEPRLPDGTRVVAGRKVVTRLNAPLESAMPSGTVIEDLGDPDAPGVDVLSILREHEIAEGFNPASDVESRQHGEIGITEADLKGRLDLRQETIITIDPADAKDHDDAVSLRIRPEGGWILGVHIADVSHFVTPESAIDLDALRNGNSVYMVDRFIPMLPPYLTAEVCSLKAGRDRLAYSVFITYDEEAEPVGVTMAPSVVHPVILLDYEKVQELIVAGDSSRIPPQFHETLKAMHHLAECLRKKRMEQGALELAMPEVNCRLDPEGRPVSITRRSSPEAYHLIEECMLAANIAVAQRIHESGRAGLYRVHEDPSEDQWSQMAADLNQLGVAEHPTDRHDLQRIALAYAAEPIGYPVSIAILRNFKRAIYSAQCLPHFGLAFDCYTHFTSPIRRYSDLIVHRILKSLDGLSAGVAYSKAECEDVAAHCSRREREADEAEEQSLIIKRIQYYGILLQRGETGPWPALITGGTARGLLVELTETLQRGFIPAHALPDPDMRMDRETGFINGRKGRAMARIGDVIAVELMRVDAGRRSVELRWVTAANATQPGKGKGRKPRNKGR